MTDFRLILLDHTTYVKNCFDKIFVFAFITLYRVCRYFRNIVFLIVFYFLNIVFFLSFELFQEKEKLYVELKHILARQPGPEVAEQLQIYQQTLKDKTKQLKVSEKETNRTGGKSCHKSHLTSVHIHCCYHFLTIQKKAYSIS